jgi:hypothetical protein
LLRNEMERERSQHCVESAGLGFNPNTLGSILGKNRSIWFSNRCIIYTLYKGPTLGRCARGSHVAGGSAREGSGFQADFYTLRAVPAGQRRLSDDQLHEIRAGGFSSSASLIRNTNHCHARPETMSPLRRFSDTSECNGIMQHSCPMSSH